MYVAEAALNKRPDKSVSGAILVGGFEFNDALRDACDALYLGAHVRLMVRINFMPRRYLN